MARRRRRGGDPGGCRLRRPARREERGREAGRAPQPVTDQSR